MGVGVVSWVLVKKRQLRQCTSTWRFHRGDRGLPEPQEHGTPPVGPGSLAEPAQGAGRTARLAVFGTW